MAANYPIKLYRGDAYDQSFRLREKLPDGSSGDPLVLTGCTVAAQIRATEDAATPLAEFDCALGADPGVVTIALTAAQTAALTGSNKIGVWDLQVTWPDTKPRTYLRGPVTLTKDVTRAVTP